MPERPEVLAIVPARAGSKGVPRKNLLRLGGHTLLWHAIQGALRSGHVTRTICSTEDDELAAEAVAAGAEVPFTRPGNLASDTAGSWAVVRHAVEELERQGWFADYVVLLQPTTPFRTYRHIDTVVSAVINTAVSSALSIRESDYPPEWMFWRAADGRLSRLFPEAPVLRRRQDARPAWQPNGLVYAVRRRLLDIDFVLPLLDTIGIPMSWEESLNIDNPWQVQLAERLWAARETTELT